jgi:hypothetical protein
VEQAGDEDVGIGRTFGAQRCDDIEPVTAVGDMHRIEQGALSS